MAFGPQRGLELLAGRSKTMRGWPATIACMRSGRTCWNWLATPDAAVAEYEAAARLTTSLPEQRYLQERASRLRLQGR